MSDIVADEVVEQVAPPVDAPAVPPAPAEAIPSWNGELESLDKEEWFTRLDDPIRTGVRAGYEAKLKVYDRGVQRKFAEVADMRKAAERVVPDLEAKLREAEAAAALYQSLFQGEDDPRVDALTAEAEALKAQIAAFGPEREAWAAEKAKIETEWREQVAAVTTERDALKTRWEEREQQDLAAESDRVMKSIPDIVAHPEAMALFEKLYGSTEESVDDLAAYVRTKFGLGKVEPPPAVAAAPPIPTAIDVMDPGDRGGRAPPVDDDSDLPMDQLVKMAAAKAHRIHAG